MNPSKVRNLIPSFAMEMEKSVEEVQSIISFYYKNLRQKLSNLEEVSVQVENLGTFYIKERSLDSEIEKYECVVEKLSNNTIREYTSKLDLKTRIEMMKSIKNKLLEEKERRKEVNIKRFGNESKK